MSQEESDLVLCLLLPVTGYLQKSKRRQSAIFALCLINFCGHLPVLGRNELMLAMTWT
jgi:hypothetical protein